MSDWLGTLDKQQKVPRTTFSMPAPKAKAKAKATPAKLAAGAGGRADEQLITQDASAEPQGNEPDDPAQAQDGSAAAEPQGDEPDDPAQAQDGGAAEPQGDELAEEAQAQSAVTEPQRHPTPEGEEEGMDEDQVSGEDGAEAAVPKPATKWLGQSMMAAAKRRPRHKQLESAAMGPRGTAQFS
eukprot:6485256-Amphidinium_carterae.1